MDYVVVVMGKYLQMLVAYSIFKKNPDQVADHFEHFNRDFHQLCEIFKEVTHQTYKAGQDVGMMKPVGPVKPIARQTSELALSVNERLELQEFVCRHDLQELLCIFCKEGVTLAEVLSMSEEDLKELGVKKYGLRKRLLGAARTEREGRRAPGVTEMGSEEQVQPEEQAQPDGEKASGSSMNWREEKPRIKAIRHKSRYIRHPSWFFCKQPAQGH